MHTKTLIIYLSVLMIASILWGSSLSRSAQDARARYSADRSDTEMQERNQSAFALILGEVRATMADLMFMKTSAYLHAGVGYASRLQMEGTTQKETFAGCGPGTPTSIRNASEDFRGFLGSIEREVKPFRDSSQAHVHTTTKELIPWFRVMTLTNPHYIRGYRVGSKILADEKQWAKCLDFLNEGIRNNPNNPELFLLYQSIASLHLRGKNYSDYPWRKDWLSLALEATRKAYELGKTQRPSLGELNKIQKDLAWSQDLEEDFRFCAHLVPLLLRDQGKMDEALRTAQEIQAQMPNYSPIRQTVQQLLALTTHAPGAKG
jgi:hypothetical protein